MATVKGRRPAASARHWYLNRDLAGLTVVSLGAVSAIAVLSLVPHIRQQQVQVVAAPTPTALVNQPPEATTRPAPLPLPPNSTPRSPAAAPAAPLTVTALTLDLRGGTGVVIGLTDDGMAYGWLGPKQTGDGATSYGWLARWDVTPGRSHAPVRVPRSKDSGRPAVSSGGVVAWTEYTEVDQRAVYTPVALVDGRLVTGRTRLNSQVYDINASGKVLLGQINDQSLYSSNGKASWPRYVWDPATGVRQRVLEAAQQILDDGSVLAQHPDGMTGRPRENLVWHDETITPLAEPPGWTARVSGGNGFAAITGTLIQGTNGDPERDTAHAVVWRQGRLEVLPGLGGRAAVGADVNRAGTIVGAAQLPSGQPRAMRWSNGRGTDLGTLGGQRSWAVDVSDSGVIVGWSTTADGVQHAVAWLPDGRITDLGARLGRTTESSAQGVAGTRIYGTRTGPDDTLIPVVWTISRI